ncbi:cytochrome o ubiquinol oxidase subunit 2 [Sphingomonas jinjuensis]|uniref:Ubiquinol oxidase subunit 2 n=1 Tax=Sphingomonas jinjuensis TaxID=535907 RepID=A0A840FH06_9SPHN|nr:cytochrome o ubiquinol oxidase subunit 2 [Sphingomonas jinjuensis]
MRFVASSRIAVAATALILLGGCVPGVLDPAGPIGAGERTILLNSLVIMLGIVVPTIIAAAGFAWWFRAGNEKATYRPDWSYSGKLELLVWSVPLLVVIFLAGMTWIGSHQLDPFRPIQSTKRPIRVQVVSLNWKWVFIYPDQGVATVNRLVMPIGTPVNFEITSGTVMNSFFIPQLGSQIYAMPGMRAKLSLQADRPGSYRGLSAHYSGEGFADMVFRAEAVSPAAFQSWAQSLRGRGGLLDDRAYLALARKEETSRPGYWGSVSPNLFDAAVAQAGVPVHKVEHHGRERL